MNRHYGGRLETERLILRPCTSEDLDALTMLNSDPEVMRYISSPLSRQQVADVIAWFVAEWERLSYGWFALFEKEAGDFVGQCGLQCLEARPDSSETELAFVIAKEFWNKGYATEAAKAVLRFGFDQRRLPEIVAVTTEENYPSQRLLKKLGFEYKADKEMYARTVRYYTLERESSL